MGISTVLKDAFEKSYKNYFIDTLYFIDTIIPEDITKDQVVKELAYTFRKHTRYIRNLGENLMPGLITNY